VRDTGPAASVVAGPKIELLDLAESTKSPTLAVKQIDAGKGLVIFEAAAFTEADLRDLAAFDLSAAKARQLFGVYTLAAGKSDPADHPPLLGTYAFDKKALRFEPRFPLVRGVTYQAVFDSSLLPSRKPDQQGKVTLSFSLPSAPAQRTTRVETVYPTIDLLPENQLKFYIHFSAPMSRGESYRHVHLLKADGKEVEAPFLELEQELWDPTGKRFTLFFDPGRIKRGLKPREEVGPSLEEGKSYTLVIDADWADAEGQPLVDAYRKSFRVGPPIDDMPDVKTWKLTLPAAASSGPLQVTFPRPMDHAEVYRMLWIVDGAGKQVEGDITTAEHETHWLFTPRQPWKPASYHLVADKALEDLAGNSPGKPFEVDLFKPVTREVKTETVKVPFTIK
jgi:hypothetical protein